MALTQVRALFNGEWVTLTLNEATGRYEAQVTAQGTSYHQPGGYWPVSLEAQNQEGTIATASPSTMSALKFVVREESAPTLTLVSPSPGYLLSQAVTFVFEAVDEEGGSGVDPGTFSLPGAATEAIPGGYRFTWSATWADGPHTMTASVSDHDGNVSSVSGAYIVDTVPPELYLKKPYRRHITDAEAVLVAGVVVDTTTPNMTVTVDGKAVPVASGKFESSVPLKVGENTIPITVTDGAGNVTTGSVYMIRLITDRDVSDLDTIMEIQNIPVDEWTDEQRQRWNAAIRRGSVDEWTLNRVGVAVEFLAGKLRAYGYDVTVDRKTDFIDQDVPTASAFDSYLKDVSAAAEAQAFPVTQLPDTLDQPTLDKFNRVEKALVDADEYFPLYFAWSAGEVSSGGY